MKYAPLSFKGIVFAILMILALLACNSSGTLQETAVAQLRTATAEVSTDAPTAIAAATETVEYAASTTPTATKTSTVQHINTPEPTITQQPSVTEGPSITPSLTATGTATATATSTPTATSDFETPTAIWSSTATAAAQPTPTRIVMTVASLPTEAVLVCSGYPCFNNVNVWQFIVVSQVWECTGTSEVISAVPCGSVPARQVNLRSVGDHIIALCVLEVTSGGSLWASEQKCGAVESWTAVKVAGKQYMNVIGLR